jgi:hypothetical protein
MTRKMCRRVSPTDRKERTTGVRMFPVAVVFSLVDERQQGFSNARRRPPPHHFAMMVENYTGRPGQQSVHCHDNNMHTIPLPLAR